MKFIRLTNLIGETVVVSVEAIAMLRPALPGENGNTAVMFTSGTHQWVKQTIAEIEARISVDAQIADQTSHR